MKKFSLQVKGIHYIIHPYDVTSQIIPAHLQEVLNFLIKIMN